MSNVRIARAVSVRPSSQLRAIDEAPPELRRALWGLAVPIDAAAALRRYRELLASRVPPARAVADVLATLARREREEMQDWAQLHGNAHFAARATVMRYHARRGGRRRPAADPA